MRNAEWEAPHPRQLKQWQKCEKERQKKSLYMNSDKLLPENCLPEKYSRGNFSPAENSIAKKCLWVSQ